MVLNLTGPVLCLVSTGHRGGPNEYPVTIYVLSENKKCHRGGSNKYPVTIYVLSENKKKNVLKFFNFYNLKISVYIAVHCKGVFS